MQPRLQSILWMYSEFSFNVVIVVFYRKKLHSARASFSILTWTNVLGRCIVNATAKTFWNPETPRSFFSVKCIDFPRPLDPRTSPCMLETLGLCFCMSSRRHSPSFSIIPYCWEKMIPTATKRKKENKRHPNMPTKAPFYGHHFVLGVSVLAMCLWNHPFSSRESTTQCTLLHSLAVCDTNRNGGPVGFGSFQF